MNPEFDISSEELIANDTGMARRFRLGRLVSIVVGIFLSVVLGIALVRLPPLMVIGGVAGLLSSYIVLRYPFLGLLLYTIVYMWRPAENYPVLAPLRLEFVIGALASAAMIVQRFREQGMVAFDNTRVSRLLLLVGLTIAVSVPFAYSPSRAMAGFEAFLKLGVWYLLVVHLLTTPVRFRVFSVVFLTAICKLSFDALRSYFGGGWVKYAQGIDRLIGQNDAAGDPNHFAATCAATIPILLLLAFQKRLRWYRLFPAGGVVLLTVALSLTGSRSGFLGLLAMLIYLWAKTRHRLVIGLVGMSVLAAGFVVLPEQYKIRYSTITAEERDGSSQGRIDIWKTGLRMIADRPLNGVGIGCFAVASAIGYSDAWLESHSLYVQVPSEVGLIGAVVFFAYLFELFRFSSRSRRELLKREDKFWFEETVLRAIPAGLVALLVTGVFGHSFMRHTWYLYGAMIVAAIRMQGRWQDQDH